MYLATSLSIDVSRSAHRNPRRAVTRLANSTNFPFGNLMDPSLPKDDAENRFIRLHTRVGGATFMRPKRDEVELIHSLQSSGRP
jgi:hypothetical protein